MTTSDSSKDCPVSVGARKPTAGSPSPPPVSGRAGRSSPLICTEAISCVALDAAAAPVPSAESPPSSEGHRKTTAAMTSTTAAVAPPIIQPSFGWWPVVRLAMSS